MKTKCTVFNEKNCDEGTMNVDEIKGEKSKEVEKQDMKKDKGAMLMKLMGWKGGGLGKIEDGRIDIVKVDLDFRIKTINLYFLSFHIENFDVSLGCAAGTLQTLK